MSDPRETHPEPAPPRHAAGDGVGTGSTWARARALLAAMHTAASPDGAEVLEARARRLSAPLRVADEDVAGHALELFCGGRAAWIELRFIRRVYELRRITRLPASPRCLLGVARFERQLLPVLDLGTSIGEGPSRLAPPEARLIAIGRDQAELVLAAEATAGTVPVATASAAVGAGRASLVRALGPAGQVVLDCERLLEEPCFTTPEGGVR